jgi:hypothetical protein
MGATPFSVIDLPQTNAGELAAIAPIQIPAPNSINDLDPRS